MTSVQCRILQYTFLYVLLYQLDTGEHNLRRMYPVQLVYTMCLNYCAAINANYNARVCYVIQIITKVIKEWRVNYKSA